MAYRIVKSTDTEHGIRETGYHAACITCGEQHGDGVPCRDTEWRRYWKRLGEQAKALLLTDTTN